MAGRKSLCNEEVTQQVTEAIEAGLTNKDAATLIGIGESTFYDWVARGESEKSRLSLNKRARSRKSELVFLEFSESIKKAKVKRKLHFLKIIKAASLEQWQAAAWMLERLYPEEFAQRVLIQKVVEKELEQLLDLLEEKLDEKTFAEVIVVLARKASEETSEAKSSI